MQKYPFPKDNHPVVYCYQPLVWFFFNLFKNNPGINIMSKIIIILLIIYYQIFIKVKKNNNNELTDRYWYKNGFQNP